MGSYMSVLRRRLGYVLAIAVVLTPLLAWALTPDARYVSTAAVQTGNTLAAGVIGANVPYEDPENRLATEVEIFGSRAVAERAAEALQAQGWSESAADLADMVTMTPRGLSTLLDIQGTADTAERAEQLTAAFLDAYLAERRAAQQSGLSDVVAGLEAQRAEADAALAALGDLSDPDAVTPEVQRQATALESWIAVLDDRIQQARLRTTVDTTGVVPVAGASPAEPAGGLGTTATVVLAAAASLLVAVGVVLLLDAWRNPVRTRREATELLALPVVGELPRVAGRYKPEDALGDPDHPVTGASRGLRLRLTALHGGPPRTVLVTALPTDADDGIHAAIALAAASGRAGKNVALVVDPRACGPRWAKALRAGRPTPVGSIGLHAAPSPMPGVWLVPPAGRDGAPGLLDLASPRDALRELGGIFDLVVLVDVAAGVPDAAGLGDLADATLVTVALERTPAGALEELRRTLEDFGLVVDGVVLAGRRRRASAAPRKAAGRAESGRAPEPERPAVDDPALLP